MTFKFITKHRREYIPEAKEGLNLEYQDILIKIILHNKNETTIHMKNRGSFTIS